jgi:protein-disulfide isomerase
MLRISTLLLTAVVLALAGCQPKPEGSESQAGGEVAAEVNGVAITTGELDAWIKEDLFRARAENPSALFQLRQAGLRQMIENRVVEQEAEKRGVTEEVLLEQLAAELGPVSDEEVQAFYDKNKSNLGGVPFDQIQDQIRDYLAGRREEKARANLRESASIVMRLEPPRVAVAAEGPARGAAEGAPVTIVEFSDFQCPFCRKVLPTIQQVLARYPDQVRFVYRHFPLGSHARARPAAEASMCADEQQKFWPFHDRLFQSPNALSDEDLLRYAGELGLDQEAFKKCVAEGRFAAQVDRDLQAGREAGVTGTPAFFVNGVLISGSKPADDFFEMIDGELARAAAQAKPEGA